jgi:hypothetical protein
VRDRRHRQVPQFDCRGLPGHGPPAGAAVTSFRVRHQFSDGDLVCSVVDWTMAPVPGTLSAAEVLEIRDGRVVRGELFYDAEKLRKAMAQDPTV